MAESKLTIAIVDVNEVRAAILRDGLDQAGLPDVTVIAETRNLLRRIVALDPDVVIIDLENPSRDVVEQMFLVSRAVARPVAMFVDRTDAQMTQAAIDAGVAAYVVDGLTPERIKSIVDLAITRFDAVARLQNELAEARSELNEQRTIDRAKRLLMRTHGLSEPEAYALLRSAAMKQHRKIAQVAESVVSTAGLLDKL